MNGQKIANFLTSLFLIGGVALVAFFMVIKWDVFSEKLARGGTTITAGIVAFVVTFLVLILVTLVIAFLKWILNREPKEEGIVTTTTVSQKTTVQKIQNSGKKQEDDSELIAVLMGAIYASNQTSAPYDMFRLFKVKEMITSSSSWRIFSKDDLSGIGG